MKIGIIGSSGFIGSNLKLYLTKNNNSKIYIFPSYKKYKTNWVSENIKIIKKIKPDIIINCAANQSLTDNKKVINELLYSNLYANIKFLYYAVKNKNFKGYITFGSKYEFNSNKEYYPSNFYGATKNATDLFLKYFAIKNKITCVSLKLFDTYGMNDNRKKIINILLKNYKKKKLTYLSPGNQYLDFVHINDLCSLIEILCSDIINNKLINFNTFTVSSLKPIKLRNLVNVLKKKLRYKLKVKLGAKKYREDQLLTSLSKFNNYPKWKNKHILIKELKKIFDGNL